MFASSSTWTFLDGLHILGKYVHHMLRNRLNRDSTYVLYMCTCLVKFIEMPKKDRISTLFNLAKEEIQNEKILKNKTTSLQIHPLKNCRYFVYHFIMPTLTSIIKMLSLATCSAFIVSTYLLRRYLSMR